MTARSRLILDVDNTVADFTGHVIEVMGLSITREQQTERNIQDQLTKEQNELFNQLMDTPEFWGTLEPLPYAVEGVRYVRKKDWSILWATSPWPGCPLWGHMRYQWLKERFDTDTDDVMIGAKKEALTGAVFLDDKLYHIETWQRENPNGLALLYDHPYNKSVKAFQRFTWKNVSKVFG